MIYIVKSGDTLYSIAREYLVSSFRLGFDNQIGNDETLVPGQTLLILTPERTVNATEGQTLEDIATQENIPYKQLVRNNLQFLTNPLEAGGQVVLTYKNEYEPFNLSVGGYAYPFINQNVLEETLPFLTELSVFSYGFTSTGQLIPPSANNFREMAQRWAVNRILVLTSITATGTFSNELVHELLTNENTRNELISQLISEVNNEGYIGVETDFEYILPEDVDAYVGFVTQLRTALAPFGKRVYVDLPPKISDEQKGLLYEGIDYEALGNAADEVLLMTYEWGYTYGPPMAVAPIPSVRRVLDYAVTKIPVEKISMGIPNYGYDWPLPYERGITKAKTIGNLEAVGIARTYGVDIQYDEVSKSPFINYVNDGIEHQVWFEDVRSIEEKLNLVKEYGFRGVRYWTIMRPFRSNWLLLNQYGKIEENAFA